MLKYRDRTMQQRLIIGGVGMMAIVFVLVLWSASSANTEVSLEEQQDDTSRYIPPDGELYKFPPGPALPAAAEQKQQPNARPVHPKSDVYVYPDAVMPESKLRDLHTELSIAAAAIEEVEGFGSFFYEGALKRALVPAFNVKTVCEIGFNAGHSSAMWLSSSPDVRLFSFDLCYHKYVQQAKAKLQSIFGESRVHLTCGSSAISIPIFVAEHPILNNDFPGCDIMHVDGDHEHNGPIVDLVNMKKLLRPDGPKIVIMDDCPCPKTWCIAPSNAWDVCVANKYVAPISCLTYNDGPIPHGFCYGVFADTTMTDAEIIAKHEEALKLKAKKYDVWD